MLFWCCYEQCLMLPARHLCGDWLTRNTTTHARPGLESDQLRDVRCGHCPDGVTFVKQTKCRKIPERQHTRIKAHYQQLGFRCVLRPGVRLPSTQGTSSSSRQWWTHIGYQSLQSVRCAVTYFWILRDFGTSALEEGREGEGEAEEVQWVFSMSVKLC